MHIVRMVVMQLLIVTEHPVASQIGGKWHGLAFVM